MKNFIFFRFVLEIISFGISLIFPNKSQIMVCAITTIITVIMHVQVHVLVYQYQDQTRLVGLDNVYIL